MSEAMSTAAPVAGAAPTEAPQPQFDPKAVRAKIKVGDFEKELGFDELVTNAQKGFASDKKFQEAALIRKQVDDLFSGMRQKDISSFKKMAQAVGPDAFRELAENYLLEHIEFDRLPDYEKKRMAAEQRAKELEEKLLEKDKESDEAQRNHAKQTAMQEIDSDIAEALKSYQGKVTPRLVARIVERMIASLSSREARLPASQAAKIEFNEIKEEFKDYLKLLPLDELRSILPKELIEGLRKADLELARGQFTKSDKSSTPKQQSSSKNRSPKRMRSDDWFRNMESRFGS